MIPTQWFSSDAMTCRFCRFTVPRWQWTTRTFGVLGREVITGEDRIDRHVRTAHKSLFDEVRQMEVR